MNHHIQRDRNTWAGETTDFKCRKRNGGVSGGLNNDYDDCLYGSSNYTDISYEIGNDCRHHDDSSVWIFIVRMHTVMIGLILVSWWRYLKICELSV
jgi:hypothetical protein